MNTEKKDIFQRVTDQIVKTIEEGAGSYRMPWRTSGGFPHSPINAVSRKAYRGVNVLILWATAEERGYKSGMWATYKQWIELGAQVRKGEKSANVVFWKFFDCSAEKENGAGPGETSLRRIPMARDYWVFNSEQVDNFTEVAPPATSRAERIDRADGFFRDLGVNVQPGGNQAYYRRDTDTVHMPAFEAFKEALFYYSVLCHETTHWTASASARPRPYRPVRFGSVCDGRIGYGVGCGVSLLRVVPSHRPAHGPRSLHRFLVEGTSERQTSDFCGGYSYVLQPLNSASGSSSSSRSSPGSVPEKYSASPGADFRTHADIHQRVYRGKIDTPKSDRSFRKAALAAGVLADIREWKEISRNTRSDAWVFPSETGKTPVSRDNLWRRHIGPQMEAAGFGWVDFHVMRRTHASLMNEIHDDPKLVADQLGHTLDVSQNVYTRASVARRKEAVDALEAALPVM